jgi:hypothetical protein
LSIISGWESRNVSPGTRAFVTSTFALAFISFEFGRL